MPLPNERGGYDHGAVNNSFEGKLPSPTYNPGVYRVHGRHDFNPTSMKNLIAFDQGQEMAQIQNPGLHGYQGLHQSEDPFPPQPKTSEQYNLPA